MTNRAFKQDVRDRMARTGEKYTKARRAIDEIQAAPPADIYKSTSGEPYYFVDTYDHTPYGPYGNVPAYANETDDTYEGLLSADGDGIEWETLAGKTQIATAILEHRLGAQPSQDLIDDLGRQRDRADLARLRRRQRTGGIARAHAHERAGEVHVTPVQRDQLAATQARERGGQEDRAVLLARRGPHQRPDLLRAEHVDVAREPDRVARFRCAQEDSNL